MYSMKRSIIMSALALLISAGIAAQTNVPVQTQNKEQSGKASHGQTVSETARTTEPGEGKGEIVSTQAKVQGETQKARVQTKAAAKNQGSARPANAMQKNKGAAAKGSGAGRK